MKKSKTLKEIKEINAIEITATAIEEPVFKKCTNGTEKTSVKVQSISTGRVINFVIWKNFNIKKGDTFSSVGNLNSEKTTFTGWNNFTKIIKRA